MSCPEYWQDIFLTDPFDPLKNLHKGGTDASTTLDEALHAPVMSVHVVYGCAVPNATNSSVTHTVTAARPVIGGSDVVMAAYPGFSGTADCMNDNLMKLQVGDMLRVGDTSMGVFTKYVTILEIIEITALINPKTSSLLSQTPVPAQCSAFDLGNSVTLAVDGVRRLFGFPGTGYAGSLPGYGRAFRINQVIDVTTLPTLNGVNYPTDVTTTSVATADFTTRSDIDAGTKNGGLARRIWPLYRLKGGRGNEVLKMQLPSDVKLVSAVKLMGYSMNHKKVTGPHMQHEEVEDDWFALRLKGVNGNVLSNNEAANGCFHVLHATAHNDDHTTGSLKLHEADPEGLVCVKMTPTNLPYIAAEIVDRFGEPAHFGRVHLWLRVLVTRI